MVSVPISAFEAYQSQKTYKKKAKNERRKNNKTNVPLNPLVAAELMKAASVHAKTVNVTAPASSADKTNQLLEAEEQLIKIVEAPKKVVKEFKVNVKQETRLKKKSKKKMKMSVGCEDNAEMSSVKVSDSQSELKEPSSSEGAKTQLKLQLGSKEQSSSQATCSSVSLSDSESSIEIAENFFSWLMDPIDKDDFLSLYWEKRPVHISREENRDYYSDILSTTAIDNMLRKNNILFEKNVDITSYSNGQRETLNSVGRAHAAVVWDYYRNGCSVRLLNPQTYHAQLRELNSRLQEVFGSFVGANAYLTPPNSQGFAPHYDDIEAFVLQIEGSKMWRVYAPRNETEKLPRISSPNFSQEEIGEPILEVLLKPGDLLYFPRGFIHQASTVQGEHSLHVTVSAYQRSSWADLLEKLVPAALSAAIEEDEDFRKGMPLDVLNHIGAVHSDSVSPQREVIMQKLKKLFSKLFKHAPVDAAADQLAKDHIHSALPPFLSPVERKCSVLENSERMGPNGKLQGSVLMSLETPIRLTRSNILRLVSEEDTMRIYHSMENSLEYREQELQYIDIPLEYATAVEHLIVSYPRFTPIGELPLEKEQDKVQLASELWERGLVLTREPLVNNMN